MSRRDQEIGKIEWGAVCDEGDEVIIIGAKIPLN